MNYLQIQLGKPSKQRTDCIKSVLKYVGENDNYIMISDTKYIKNDIVHYIGYDSFIENSIKKYPLIYRFFEEITNKVVISEIIRFVYAIENSDFYYIDTDIKLNKKLPTCNSVSFGQRNNAKDLCIFYSNDQSFFKNLIESIVKSHWNNRRQIFHKPNREWIYIHIQKINTNVISSEYFKHFNMMGK